MSTQASPLEERENPKSNILTTGLALFSMFFGAGNLIFPLIVGMHAGAKTPFAIFGLSFSAVAFPLLGLIAMLFCGGDLRAFLARLGKIPAFCLLFVLQMVQGPFACMPRLFTLMHASVKAYVPGLPLGLFSAALALGILLLILKRSRMVNLLGAVLTPLLLLTLALITVVGVWHGDALVEPPLGNMDYVVEGLKGGYQTMDLISALLFATLIIPHLRAGSTKEEAHRKMVGASSIAALLLMVAYIGLCFVAAHHASHLANFPPEAMLQAIAVKVLGPFGGLVAASAVFLACLTTAISLTAVFSDYLQEEILRKKTPVAFAITLFITALMANLGFAGIMKIIAPLMEILYPALIVLCLLNMAYYRFQLRLIKVPVYVALGLGVAGFCLA